MIEAIIFDLGNVLVTVDNKRTIPLFRQYLTDKYNDDELEIMLYFYNKEPENETEKFFEKVHDDYGKGKISSERFYKIIRGKIGFKKDFTYEIFRQIWPSRLVRIEQSVNVLKKLKNYKKYLLSDTDEMDISYIKTHHQDILHEFDRVFYSYETGINKMSESAWKNVLKESKSHPQTHIFIDDRPDYVQRAKSLGMKGLVFTNAEKLEADLVSAGCVLENI